MPAVLLRVAACLLGACHYPSCSCSGCPVLWTAAITKRAANAERGFARQGEKPKKPPPKKREKSVGASVMGMASAFGAGRVPGATLSELQENSMLRDRAAQPGGRP